MKNNIRLLIGCILLFPQLIVYLVYTISGGVKLMKI